jgi:pimeloyl-ACP methyl ester carboxylesterase
MKPRWKKLETSFLPQQVDRKVLEIDTTKIYYLTNKDYHTDISENEKIYCIAIHGTGGSSLNFVPLVEYLPKEVCFFFIDLPGFGKSYQSSQHNYSDPLVYVSDWIECIRKFMDIQHIHRARFIAHSFGAFITTLFASHYPECVQSLVLIGPAGLLPTLDYCGGLYGILFKVHFPYFMKFLYMGVRIVYGIYRLFCILTYRMTHWKKIFYWLACYHDGNAIAGKVVSSLITFTRRGIYWNTPIMDKLLALKIPISLIYGENDNIMPSHQGLLIQGIRPDIELDIIEGEFHNPIHRVPQLIVERCLKHTLVCRNPKLQQELCKQIKSVLDYPEQYAGSFWFSRMGKMIRKLYSDILKKTRITYLAYNN